MPALYRRPIEPSAIAERRLVGFYRRAWLLARLAVERSIERGHTGRGELRRVILAELRQLEPRAAIARIGETIVESLRLQLQRALGRRVPRGAPEVKALVAAWTGEALAALRSLLVDPPTRRDRRAPGAPLSLLELASRAVASADPREAARVVARATGQAWRRAASSAKVAALRLASQANRAVQEGVGVARYRWTTQHDERVRPEHAARHGLVFSWASPPPGGHPGEAPMCRCVAVPVLPSVRA